MKNIIKLIIFCIAITVAILVFKPLAKDALTYTQWQQNPEKSMVKYQDVWDNRTIKTKPNPNYKYKSDEVIGTITIPKMNYYEMPIHYGSNTINNNWQITTLGNLGNWDMFGENGCAAVGAHNYQLFTNLVDLKEGDLFLIDTEEDIFIYEVIGMRVYDHLMDDWSEISYKKALPYSVNLITCWPIEQGAEATEDSYIVYSKMVKGTKYID